MPQFTTDRVYNGQQVISYNIIQSEDASQWMLGSNDLTVEFHDESRGIKGCVWLPMICDQHDLKRSLMLAYDAGHYTNI
jgi:hypothetical protein